MNLDRIDKSIGRRIAERIKKALTKTSGYVQCVLYIKVLVIITPLPELSHKTFKTRGRERWIGVYEAQFSPMRLPGFYYLKD